MNVKELSGAPSFGEGGRTTKADQLGRRPIPSIVPERPENKPTNQASLGEMLHQDLVMAAQGTSDLDRATNNSRWAPPFFLWNHIKRRKRRPASWTIYCAVCKRYECYLFDPFRSKHLHSLARDCPLRIEVSDREIPPTSALRSWICPGSFWKRVGKFWRQPYEAFCRDPTWGEGEA